MRVRNKISCNSYILLLYATIENCIFISSIPLRNNSVENCQNIQPNHKKKHHNIIIIAMEFLKLSKNEKKKCQAARYILKIQLRCGLSFFCRSSMKFVENGLIVSIKWIYTRVSSSFFFFVFTLLIFIFNWERKKIILKDLHSITTNWVHLKTKQNATCSCRKPNTTDHICSAITLSFVGVVVVVGFIFQTLGSQSI